MDDCQFEIILREQVKKALDELKPHIDGLSELPSDMNVHIYGKRYNEDILDDLVSEFKLWQRGLVELFLTTLGESNPHTVRFMETVTETNFFKVYDAKRALRRELMDSVTYIEAILPYVNQIEIQSNKMEIPKEEKSPKLFISHSSKDKMFVEELVSLLEFLGFKDDNMFCSSVEGYGIPLGKNIFEHLRTQFERHQLFVLFVHSPNYYNSSVSLNEMGAAWALKQSYFSILTKDMQFIAMTGVVSSREIAIKIDTADAKLRLNEMKVALQKFFALPQVNESRWEKVRDKFISAVNN